MQNPEKKVTKSAMANFASEVQNFVIEIPDWTSY